MRFKKNLMLKRLEEEGILELVNDEMLKIMDLLDNKKVDENTWNNRVLDLEPRYIIKLGGTDYPINSSDCE